MEGDVTMAKMKWYGCVQSRLMAASKMPEPKVGMGLTELLWSDRHAYEVIEVQDKTHCKIRALKYERTDSNGISESQTYKYTSNPDGEIKHLVFRNGRWRSRKVEEVYLGNQKWENRLTRKLESSEWFLGKAEEYRDPCF